MKHRHATLESPEKENELRVQAGGRPTGTRPAQPAGGPLPCGGSTDAEVSTFSAGRRQGVPVLNGLHGFYVSPNKYPSHFKITFHTICENSIRSISLF